MTLPPASKVCCRAVVATIPTPLSFILSGPVGSTLDDDLDPLEGAVELDELAVVELVRLETRLARVATRGEEVFAEVDEGAVLDEGGRGRVEVELEAELTSADKPARERERNQRRRQR